MLPQCGFVGKPRRIFTGRVWLHKSGKLTAGKPRPSSSRHYVDRGGGSARESLERMYQGQLSPMESAASFIHSSSDLGHRECAARFAGAPVEGPASGICASCGEAQRLNKEMSNEDHDATRNGLGTSMVGNGSVTDPNSLLPRLSLLLTSLSHHWQN